MSPGTRSRRPRASVLSASDPTRLETGPNARSHTKPKGASGTVIQLGDIAKFELTNEIKGKAWFEMAAEMVQDPHVKRSVEAIVDPLLAAFWDMQAGDKTPLAMEVADYARWNILECNNWERLLRLSVGGMVRNGVELFEPTERDDLVIPTERFPLHPGRGYGVGYAKFHHRPAKTVERWIQSKRDPERAAGIVQWIDGSDAEEPGERVINLEDGDLLLRMVWDQEGANFGGNPALRAAYGAFKMKRLLMTLSMMRHEREGLGVPTISEPDNGFEPTKGESDIAKKILRNLRAHEQSYIYLPNGYGFEWTTSGGQSTGIQEAIEHCNRDIAYNMGVAWMLLGIAGRTGSHALATEQRGHYVLSLEKYARAVESSFNFGPDGWSPIERLVRRNYGPNVPLPRLLARNMPTRDWGTLLPMLPQLVKSGLLKSDEVLRGFLRNVMYLPVEDPATLEEMTAEARDLLEKDPDPAATQPPEDEEARAQAAANERFLEQITTRVSQLERAMLLASRVQKESTPA